MKTSNNGEEKGKNHTSVERIVMLVRRGGEN